MNQTHIDRLKRLIFLMEQMKLDPIQRDPKLGIIAEIDHFDIGTVADFRQSGQHFCPTAACAIGTAMFDPWFNDQGLGHDLDKSIAYAEVHDYNYAYPSALIEGEQVSYCGEEMGQFFGVDESQINWLTNGDQYEEEYEIRSHRQITPDMVIKRINHLLGEHA